jgi:nucleoid-associated protein YgaU
MQYQRIKSQNSELLSVGAWIRQKFVDGHGPNPESWAYRKYTLLLPDDSEIEGWTDAEGNIRPENDIEVFGKIAWFIHRDTGEEPEIWPPDQLPEKPIYYKIKEDDTLRKIASYDFIYGDPYLWHILHDANKHNFIDNMNSNLIEIGQTLIIPLLTGETRNGTR